MKRPSHALPLAALWVLGWLGPAPAEAAKPLLLVTDSPYEIFQGGATWVHVVVFDPAFRPVPGARVLIGSQEVGRTDARGGLVFRHKPRGWFWLRAEAELGGVPHAGQVGMEAYRRTESFESHQLFVHTDRGVVRPGEVLHLRALCWRLRGEFRPVDGAEVEVSLVSPEGAPVAGEILRTDTFGVAATDLRVPGDAPEGLYQLRVHHADASETARVRVLRFTPPAIDIRHDLPRFVAPASPDLAVEVRLAYFAGGAPEDGTLRAAVRHAGAILHELERPIAKGEPLHFTLPLEPVRQKVPEGARFEIVLTARDGFGRQDELIRDVLYTARPYLAVPDLDKDFYAPGEEIALSVRLQDPDGVPVRGKELSALWEGGGSQTARTDAGGVALFRLRMPDHALAIEVRAADAPEPLCKVTAEPLAAKPMKAEVEQPVLRERRPVPLRIVLDPSFEPVERVVHVDVTDYSGALSGGFDLPLRPAPGGAVAAGSFPAPGWGSMLLTLYTAGVRKDDARRGRSWRTVGLLTEGLSLTAHPDKELTIALDGVPDQAAPRARLAARLRVSGPDRKAREALLGVMLVDRAVLSLLDPLEKTPMDRFYNPTLKVLSTTGSDILTWPVVSRNWGDEQMDIALPPFGFREGGQPPMVASRGPAGGVVAAEAASGYGDGGGAPLAKKAPAIVMGAAPLKSKAHDMPAEPMPEASAQAAERNDAAPARPGRPTPSAAPAPPPIVIRTDLPETALWLPRLLARGGQASLEIVLPEAITEQELIAVASDRRGGLGLLRRAVRVTQPLFVRADVPRALSAGDRLEVAVLVRCAAAEAREARVSLRPLVAGPVAVEPAEVVVPLPEDGAGVARFRLQAQAPGRVKLRTEARAGALGDGEERELEVRPAGAPVEEIRERTLAAAAPLAEEIALAPGEYAEAHLEIAFPGVGPAVLEVDEVLARSAWWADSHLATPLAAAALERYLARARPDHPKRAALRTYLGQVAGGLPALLAADGGASWWRRGPGSTPLATAEALRLLTALREADLAVADDLFHRAAAWLRRAQEQDGLWPTSDIAWWEGGTEKIRLQLGAFVFRALAEASRAARPEPGEREALRGLAERFARELDAGIADPLTAATAALGLHALGLGLPGEDAAGVRARLQRVAKRLLELRRTSHWEPSWFHAYGGAVEATAAGLELLLRLDPKGLRHGPVVREALAFLLSTRPSWGGWHNPFGTAEAVRAFTLLQPPAREVPSTVRVLLGDREIASVRIDPRDPYGSALALQHLELPLAAGANALRVGYDGKLEVPAHLVIRRYPGQAVAAAPAPGGALRLARRLSRAEVRVGEPVEVTLALEAEKPGLFRLVGPKPPNADVEVRSLAALRTAPGVIEVRELPGRLELLVQGQSLELRYRLAGARPGEAAWPPAEAQALAGAAPRVQSQSDRLVVR